MQHLEQHRDVMGTDMNVVVPTYDELRNVFRGRIVSNFWQCSMVNPERRPYRPSQEEKFGEGCSLFMPLAASWESNGPDAEEPNVVAYPSKVDRTFVDYMQRIGVLGDHAFLDRFEDFPALAKERGMKIYNVDDMPEGWDDVTENGYRTTWDVNVKKNLRALSAYAAPYEVVDLRTTTAEDFERHAGEDGVLFLKLNNTENTGDGVIQCKSADEYLQRVQEQRARAEQHDLDMEVVLQPKIVGKNRSVQFVITPDENDTVYAIALSNQITGDDGQEYQGNENPPLTLETIDPKVASLMTDLAARVKAVNPQAFGFVMCDFFETDDGDMLTFDPGLRATGNTPTILARMFTEQMSGKNGQLRSRFFAMSEGSMFKDSRGQKSFADYIRPADKIVYPEESIRSGTAVLPWGYNQHNGMLLSIAVGETEGDIDELIRETRSMIES